jgi:Skp family chaperone for outer membrane proteins
MVQKLMVPLRKALRQLETEKRRIDREITAVRAALEALGDKDRGTPASSTRAKARRRRMSLAARRLVSQRMKAYWTKRRAASAKGKVKGTQQGK